MEPLLTPAVDAWAHKLVQRMGAAVQPPRNGRRGLLMVHLDGTPRAVLADMLAKGRMPFLSRLLASKRYALTPAFWGSPASTPCFQAGLLYGIRHPNLPAYQWWDRELGRLIHMSKPRDAMEIERRLAPSEGESLLAGGGMAYLSLFRAGAENLLCMSALSQLKRILAQLARDLGGLSRVSRRGAFVYAAELWREVFGSAIDAYRWVRQVKDLRHEREFLRNRLLLSGAAWGYAHSRALLDMAAGAPALYLVYGSYDEVAHRRGPRSEQALRELQRVDGSLEELYAVANTLRPGYDMYILTDHGHVDSDPLERRQGRGLTQVIAAPSPSLPIHVEQALLAGRAPAGNGAVHVDDGEPVVIDAGNFAHVYLGKNRALEARELLARHRPVLARLCAERDVGIAAIRRGDGAVALIQGEVFDAESLSKAPLNDAFSRQALADLLRELPHMATAGDVVLFGEATHREGTVGFAWEFGSHGGVTKAETESLVLSATDAPVDVTGLTHSTQLHQRLRAHYRGE